MTINCQDCGKIIYWDNEMKDPVELLDDISAPPYVTASGDLFCEECGRLYDEAELEDVEEIKFNDGYDREEVPAKEKTSGEEAKKEAKPE